MLAIHAFHTKIFFCMRKCGRQADMYFLACEKEFREMFFLYKCKHIIVCKEATLGDDQNLLLTHICWNTDQNEKNAKII